MIPQASRIYKAKTKILAVKRFNRFCQRWQDIEPQALKCFKRDFYDTLNFYNFSDDKNFISTTNHLERDLETALSANLEKNSSNQNRICLNMYLL